MRLSKIVLFSLVALFSSTFAQGQRGGLPTEFAIPEHGRFDWGGSNYAYDVLTFFPDKYEIEILNAEDGRTGRKHEISRAEMFKILVERGKLTPTLVETRWPTYRIPHRGAFQRNGKALTFASVGEGLYWIRYAENSWFNGWVIDQRLMYKLLVNAGAMEARAADLPMGYSDLNRLMPRIFPGTCIDLDASSLLR